MSHQVFLSFSEDLNLAIAQLGVLGKLLRHKAPSRDDSPFSCDLHRSKIDDC